MSAQEYLNVLFSLFGIVTLGFILWGLYPKYAVDKFRQELFIVRDDLFDAAAGGRIPVDGEAYRLMRLLVNSHIRYAHRISLISTVGMALYVQSRHQQLGSQFSSDMDSAMSGLDENQTAFINNIYQRIIQLVFRRLVLGSVFVMMIIPAALGAAIVTYGIGLLMRKFEHSIAGVNEAFIADLESEIKPLSLA